MIKPSKAMIAGAAVAWPIPPVRRTTRLASDWLFLADAYGSNINAAPAISVGTRAPRKRYSGEIPASPNREARID
jgi:hypothetical protein